MRRIGIALLALSLVSLLADTAEARRWWRRRGRTYTRSYSAPANCYSGTDQQRCYAEASYMASRGISGHVGGVIGSFEGVGVGGSNCATCTPSGRLTLTGDAQVVGAGGRVYRVRSWR